MPHFFKKSQPKEGISHNNLTHLSNVWFLAAMCLWRRGHLLYLLRRGHLLYLLRRAHLSIEKGASNRLYLLRRGHLLYLL